MSAGPLLSIVVNNYNYARFLRECIDSALAQTYPSTEVVVVDDGSTDASREIIAAYGPAVKAVFKSNGGQASAYHAGLEAARGVAICYLDADDVLLPTAMESAAPYFVDEGVSSVSWPLALMNGDGTPTGDRFPRVPLVEGDLRQRLIHYGPDSWAVGSGGLWSRPYLSCVLPAPDGAYRKGADGYLITLAPLFGLLKNVPEPQGRYRIHGQNGYWQSSVHDRVRGSLLRYEDRARTLQSFLALEGVDADPAAWRQRNPYYQWMCRIDRSAGALLAIIPAGERYLLADQHEWGTPFLPDRTDIPFTERDGVYWGPPADDAAAIEELERQRTAGVRFLAVGWPAFWWLDHYRRFARYLHERGGLMASTPDVMTFSLVAAE